MNRFPENPSKAAMKAAAFRARVALWVALGVIGVAPCGYAAITGPAPVHTAAAVGRIQRTHGVHHRSRHARHVIKSASLRATPVTAARTPVPVPETPQPHRNHRHATVPHVAQSFRPSRTGRAGAHQALAIPSGGVLMTLETRALSARQNLSTPEVCEDPVRSGRGPPRASPDRASAGSSATLASDATASASFLSRYPNPSPRPSTRAAGRSLPRALRVRYGQFRASLIPGWAFGRLHVRRIEGQAACISMPSFGGSPCSA
ncbi:MAG TPA: hypothetical protein VGK93_04820 [Candidatus Eisenbacteria bacterium]|jgi:hypothetical protein